MLQLGRARFALTQSLGEVWSAHLDASMFDDKDRSPVGLTEAYLLFRPYPCAGYRFRVKAGAFYAPISLENRASGWESPYTLSYSAINSWLAVEVRTVGVEGTLDWLGTRSGHAFDLGVTGGVFGWNQGAGVVLANNGFSLTDRQTPLFGRVGQPGDAPLEGAEPFLQFDHREGVYGGIEVRYLDRVVLRALRYDNRANPQLDDGSDANYSQNTRFNSAGVRVEGDHGWTAIAQWLDGETTTGSDDVPGVFPAGRSAPNMRSCPSASDATRSVRATTGSPSTPSARTATARRAGMPGLRHTSSMPMRTGASPSSGCRW